jgi:hypothetical protein
MIAATLEIERIVGLSLAAPREISSTRRARVATATVLGVLGLGLFAWWVHTPLVLHATASAQLVGNYAADNAIDDNTKTAWLLPDKQTGWIDVTFGKARSVGTVRIDSSNAPYNDRSTKDAHIEAFLADKLVKSADVTFKEPVGREPVWTDIGLGAKCDRVRISVRSFYKNAAAIAEVQIK